MSLPALSMLLLSVLLHLCTAVAPGTIQFLLDRVASDGLPPRAYRLTAGQQLYQTITTEHVLMSLTNLPETSCRHHCLHRPQCLGITWRRRDGTCVLADRRPVSDRLSAAGEPWLVAAREGVSFLDEPCAASADCLFTTPWSRCQTGVCRCLEMFPRTTDAGCRPDGQLVPSITGRPDATSLLAEPVAADAVACRRHCAAEPLCMSAEFSPSAGCHLYHEAVTRGDVNGDSVTFTMQLSRLHGEPPAGYTLAGGGWYSAGPAPRTMADAMQFCAASNAIVWPGRADAGPLQDAGLLPADGGIVRLGLDDTGVEGTFVFSDGEPDNSAGAPVWLPGYPKLPSWV